MRVGIVCDSTCDLGPTWLAAHDVTMVPLKVLFGDDTYRDWVDMQPEEFFARLASSPVLPKTSQPSPAEFEDAYRTLAESGAEEIVSIHLSAALSGTFGSASIAAENSPVPVRLVDSRLVSTACGLVVKAAVEARDAGQDAAGVQAAAERTAANTQLFFVLDTLEYLVRGGRAGKAQGLAAALLDIKPVLRIDETGVVAPFKRARGLKRALAELAAHVAEDAAGRKLRIALLHACRPQLAAELGEAIAAAGVDFVREDDVLLGAVIGTYAGPGAVGVAYLPLD